MTHTTVVATVLLLARGAARLSLQAYDAALADARVALTFPPADKPLNSLHESALLLAAKAEYGLRRFRESYGWVQKLITFYPRNDEGLDMVKQCIRRIVEQEKGIYNWDSMLKEAKSGKTDSDHADYVGPIEVRVCEDSGERGLFVTRDVEPGELLLVEKAFSAAFIKQVKRSEAVKKPDRTANGGAVPRPEEKEEKAQQEMTALYTELTANIIEKISFNSSLQPAFLDLYPGLTIDKEVNKSETLGDAVKDRLKYNAFAFPLLSDPRSSSATRFSTKVFSHGLWIKASYMNHTCNPTVRRSFISDLIILRAQSHIHRDTEIRFDYVSSLSPVSHRRKYLSVYGFYCECKRCISEAETPQANLEARQIFCNDFERLIARQDGAEYRVCMMLLLTIDGTYTTPPSIEPRLALAPPLLSLIVAAKAADMHVKVISLIRKLLDALGFVLQYDVDREEQRFEILRWGFFIDEIMLVMIDLVRAFEALRQEGWRRGAEREAKKCYLITFGEDSSWELEPAV